MRAALDCVDVGLVLLDRERRAQFINRAFRRIWRVPDQVADGRPTFVKLMYHGRDSLAYAIPPDRLGAYVAQQTALIRSGEEGPLDIRLANDQALRFRCKVLPDGGRLLTYGNIGDLVRQADQLEELASIDGMTGLNNRRHFLALARAEWDRYQRYKRPLALIMLDIDLFKSVNDRYGHDVGDRVLKEVADVFRTSKRASDIVGRVGGEEFALLLPETTLDNARAAGERMRKAVANRVVAVDGTIIPITISVGASAAQEGTSGIVKLMKQADVALYEAKRAGRNRVCVFKPSEAGDSKAGERSATAA